MKNFIKKQKKKGAENLVMSTITGIQARKNKTFAKLSEKELKTGELGGLD
jgi:hypothetical protein